VVFPCWDKLHRSIRLNIPQAALQIGVAGYSAPEHNRLWSALALPFRAQRDYWRLPDGTMPERDYSVLQRRETYLAE
jgi:hypothetical protein